MFKYSITRLDRDVDNSAVITVEFKIEAFENGKTVSTVGSVFLSPNPNSQQFIKYEDLTEAIVLSWVKDKIKCNMIENELSNQLNLLKNPKVKSEIPW
jgi:hypothetical protein